MTIRLPEAILFLIVRNSSNKDQSFAPFCFMKALFYAAAFLAFLTDEKIVGADPLPSDLPAPNGNAVETIVFLRHGEKPEKEIGQINCQGLNRALALPRVLTSKYGKPDYIFAPAAARMSKLVGGYDYLRPLATIEPTAIELGMPVNTNYAYTDIKGLRSELMEKKYQAALIFVAWEHHQLEDLVKRLVSDFHGDPETVPHWKGKDFDSLYVVRITTHDSTKSISFTLDQEGLSNLSTDCPEEKVRSVTN